MNKFLIAFLCLLLVSTGKIMAQSNTHTRPNILIIVSDDHAYQSIGAYGSPYGATPNIDRLARQGAVYQNAFVTNSLCGPSRACLLTSKYSNLNGFKDNFSRFDPSQPTFASHLTEAGYQTAWIGKWHLGSLPQHFSYFKIVPEQGFYYNPDFINMDNDTARMDGYVTNVITDLSENWLKNRDTTKPFCLVIGEKATHRTWIPDTADFGAFDHINFPLPDDFYDSFPDRYAGKVNNMNIAHTMRLGYDLKMKADTGFGKDNYTRFTPSQKKYFDDYYDSIYQDFKGRHLSGKALTEWKFQRYMRDYYATVLSLDRNVGRIVDYIDKSGLGNNTIVIYTSDQGMYLGEHGWFDKRFIYDQSMKTPLVIRYPKLIKPRTIDSSMVMLLDIAPTFMQLAGLNVPSDMQGQSLIPVFKGKDKDFRSAVFYHYYEYPNEHNALPHFGIRTKRYVLVRFYKPSETWKNKMVNEGSLIIDTYNPKDYWEFYDLKADPEELHNLYKENKHSPVVKKLKATMNKLIKQYKQRDAAAILAGTMK